MKISKLFHWLYTILMFLPFGLLIFNGLSLFKSGIAIYLENFFDYIMGFFESGMLFGGLSSTVLNVYDYLIVEVFGFNLGYTVGVIECLLTYWTCISIIYLIFDVVMYVPLLVHRWLDKGVLE